VLYSAIVGILSKTQIISTIGYIRNEIYSCHAVEDNYTEGQRVFSLILSVPIFIASDIKLFP
jgi:hypothetical protein